MIDRGRMVIACPDCKRTQKVSTRLFGQVVTCSECGSQMKWMPDTEIITKGENDQD